MIEIFTHPLEVMHSLQDRQFYLFDYFIDKKNRIYYSLWSSFFEVLVPS